MSTHRALGSMPARLFAQLSLLVLWGFFSLRLRESVAGHGYSLLPPSPNAWASMHDAAGWALPRALLLWILLALPWRQAAASVRPRAWLARAWAFLPCLAAWSMWGYRYNRFDVASSWKRRVELGGLSLPEALTDPSVWTHNLLATLLALAAAIALYQLLLRLLPSSSRDSRLPVSPVLAALLLLPVVLLALLPPTVYRATPDAPDILLISLDASRADHFGAYGSGEQWTPISDQFAEGAELFENAFAPEPWTLTSHMTMLTGLYPDAHGLDFGRALPPAIWTVAERLRDAGYRTRATVKDCFLLSPRFGYAAGFDSYRESDETAAERCADAADWLLQSDRPSFQFIHLYDPHSDTGVLPYEASHEALERFAPDARAAFRHWTGADGASESLRKVNEEGLELGEELRVQLRKLYAAGLWETDQALALLFDRLRDAGRLENSLVILTADHGEALGEREHFMHERLMNATLHIPLMIHWPGREKAGSRRDELVELVDLAPTILAVADVAAEEIAQGHRLDQDPFPDRDFAFHRSGLDYAISTVDRWRLVYRRDPEIYGTSLRRIDGGGGDGPDALADSLGFVERWKPRIEAKHRANELLAARYRDGAAVAMSEMDEELLRSLGYID